MGTQQSTVADSIDRLVWLAVEVFIESVSVVVVSWSGRRGTLVGTIGAHSCSGGRVALLCGDGDDDFTTISFRFCQNYIRLKS